VLVVPFDVEVSKQFIAGILLTCPLAVAAVVFTQSAKLPPETSGPIGGHATPPHQGGFPGR